MNLRGKSDRVAFYIPTVPVWSVAPGLSSIWEVGFISRAGQPAWVRN